jgi:hypothetical protein
MIIAGEASRTSTRNCAEPPAPPKSKTARSASEANVGVPAFWKQIEAAQGALPAPAPAACATAKPSDVGGADARSGVAATAAAATIPEGAAERNGGPTSARDRVDAGAPPLALSKPSVSMDIGVMLSATYGSATEPDDDEVGSPRRICVTAATSAPGLGSPLPHLYRDWARRCHICTGTWAQVSALVEQLRSEARRSQMDHSEELPAAHEPPPYREEHDSMPPRAASISSRCARFCSAPEGCSAARL